MANLSIQGLDDAVYEQLKVAALRHGISIEEAACRILSQALATPKRISAIFNQCFGPENGIDINELPQRVSHNPIDI